MARDLHQFDVPGDGGEEPPEPPRLRLLRRLVTALTATMILAMLVIAGAFVWQVSKPSPAGSLPEEIALPAGMELRSLSRAGDELILLLRDPASGEMWVETREAATGAPRGRYRLVEEP